jgi:hypothetical protein
VCRISGHRLAGAQDATRAIDICPSVFIKRRVNCVLHSSKRSALLSFKLKVESSLQNVVWCNPVVSGGETWKGGWRILALIDPLRGYRRIDVKSAGGDSFKAAYKLNCKEEKFRKTYKLTALGHLQRGLR